MRAELLKGHLDALILAVVEREPAHGYAILERLRQTSGGVFDLPEGTLYPALHRLERAGLLASRWAEHAGRRRRVYRVTRRGRRVLAGEKQNWQSFSEAIGAVLRASP
jgi:transcriptional regulator